METIPEYEVLKTIKKNILTPCSTFGYKFNKDNDKAEHLNNSMYNSMTNQALDFIDCNQIILHPPAEFDSTVLMHNYNYQFDDKLLLE